MTNDDLLSYGLPLIDHTGTLQSLRERCGLTRGDVGGLLDMSEHRLAGIETHGTPITDDELQSIAIVLRASPDVLKAKFYGVCPIRYWAAGDLLGTMFCCWCDDGATPCPPMTPERLEHFAAWVRRRQTAEEHETERRERVRQWRRERDAIARVSDGFGSTTTLG